PTSAPLRGLFARAPPEKGSLGVARAGARWPLNRRSPRTTRPTCPTDRTRDIFYVCKKALESLKEKLKAGGEVSQDLVNELTFPEKLADEEMMVPVDMRGVGEEFDDVESMVEKLGPKGTAEAFVKAREYFEANKDKESPRTRGHSR
ncbi:unnamed protein product, partial [Prorocentrum cordatum]